MKRTYWLVFGLFVYSFGICADLNYFCTASDHKYFKWLCNCIGSIQQHHPNDGVIAVFDIGLTQEQRDLLNAMQNVTVYDVEMTHPDLLKPFKARRGTRKVPGWYAWKPVIIKQALEMYPYVLYLDAGLALHRNVQTIFDYIKKHDHFFTKSIRSIDWMSTNYVKKRFNLSHALLQKRGILGGLQGLTRATFESYVLPVYELSKDLRNFAEDGTKNTARHDQPLFSIWVYKNNYHIIDRGKTHPEFVVGGKRQSINNLINYNARWSSRGRNVASKICFVRDQKNNVDKLSKYYPSTSKSRRKR